MFLEGGLSGLSHTWNSPDTGKCFSFKSLERMQHVDFWTYPRWTTWLKPVENHPALLSSGGGSPSWSSCIRGTSGQSAPASRSQVRPTKADWMNEAFVCRLNSFEAKSLKAPTICKPPHALTKRRSILAIYLTFQRTGHTSHQNTLGQRFGLPKAYYIGTVKVGHHGGT